MSFVIHMLPSAGGSQSGSFVFETEHGLMVLDGGYRSDGESLLRRLRELSGCQVPRVEVWLLSHAHTDHIGAFTELAEKHADAFSLGELLYCFPSVQFIQRHEGWASDAVEDFTALRPRFADKVVTVTQGDVYLYPGVRIDVLYTPDPAFTHNALNNSSVVYRLTAGGRTVLFPGDLGAEAGDKVLALYGDGLKSDYVQMAHHGQSGVNRSFYEAVRPQGCLWSTPRWLWENDAGGGPNTHSWKTLVVREWMRELGAERNYVVMNGEQTITL